MEITSQLTKNSWLYNPPHEPYGRMKSEELRLRDELNELIRAGKIDFEEVSCLCGSSSFSLLGKYDRHGIVNHTVICTVCGLIQTNPKMTEKSLDWFYGSDFYDKLYGRIGGRDPKEFILAEGKRRPIKRHDYIKNTLPYDKIGSVLEIGCGGGWNLLPVLKYGKKVSGYDYAKTFVEAGRALGFNLNLGGPNNPPNNES